MNQNQVAAELANIVRSRKTEKVMCEVESHQVVPDDVADRNRKIVLDAIKTAGWAPFHYPRNIDGLAEPWRAHVLWSEAACKAAVHLKNELEVTSKEPRLAAGCNALVIVTWLPEFYDDACRANSKLTRDDQIKRDEEHLAAASAMVQNLLLVLTANGMGTYWSSGGKFRGSQMFEFLSIPRMSDFWQACSLSIPK